MIRKILLLLALTLISSFVAQSAQATDIYFAATSAGANNGADCTDAYAYTDATNGINKSVNWVAGNTLHICGTITVAAATNIISAQASGTSGSPITIKFESGAIIQAPYCGTGSSACIYLSGHSYITVNGGNTGAANGATWTTGLVRSYANGSSGQSNCPGTTGTFTATCTYQVENVSMIEATNASNITIENLGPCVGAIVTSGSFPNGAPGNDCVKFQGSNFTITNNQFWYDGNGIDNTGWVNGDANTVISNNDFQQNGWGIGCAGGSGSNTNYQVSGNHFHNFTQWAGTGAHLNGIHCYDLSGGGIQQIYIYNNTFDGNTGTTSWTSWVYLEADGAGEQWCGTTGTAYTWNNIFVNTTAANGNGLYQVGGCSGHQFLNNFVYGQYNVGSCVDISGTGNIIENNVIENCGQIISGNTTPVSLATMDYNVYGYSASGSPLWQVSGYGSGSNTLAAWQTACSCDAHSRAQLGSLLSDITSEGVPSTGFIGLLWGQNLTSTATGALASLATGTTAANSVVGEARPSGSCTSQGNSPCWDIGAYEISSSSSVTLSPSTENFGSVNVGSSSSAVSFTVTNNSSTNATSTTPSTTGGNSGDFTISSNTCGTVASGGGTCSFNVTFSPSGAGSRSTTLSVSYGGGDSASPQTSALSGTGVVGAVTLSPSSKNFGSINVGSSSSPTTFTVTNNNSGTATSINPTTTGGNSGDFTIVNSGAGSCNAAGNSLANGASCTFTVTFSPTATGSRSTTLSVSYSGADGASPRTAALSGIGTSAAATGTTMSGAAQMIGGSAKIQ